MTSQTMQPAANSDEQLVEWSLTGDRNAYRQIVERYQSLVCSITYNATGSLTLSEDLAQETFIAAWKQLSELREPARLRAWLCGITRFLVGKELRRQGHEPVHAAETLEAIHDPPSPELSPSAQAVTREEEAILWRALERIPDVYRQPLILFYREQQSVERVAVELELSEDAVKQRLARGRKLLNEEVIAFVEGTLTRTTPGQAFSGAVLAALPMAAASAASAGAGLGAKGTAAAKSGGWLALLGAWLVPIISIVGGITAQWLIVRASPTDHERRVKRNWFIGLWVFALAWCIPVQFAMNSLSQHLDWSDQTYFSVMAGFWWFYAVVATTLTIVMVRRFLVVRQESERAVGTLRRAMTPGTCAVVAAGQYLVFFLYFVWIAWRLNDRVSAGILAGLMVGLGVWKSVSLRGKAGVAATRAAAGHLALTWAIILVVLNLRLNAWMAAAHECSLAEMHRLLPMWVIPVLTLALLAWSGLVFALTKPKRPS
ncbi:MAG: sigma-70 family RNA polymerase sigma factor [Verrucomicrobiia bacterium]